LGKIAWILAIVLVACTPTRVPDAPLPAQDPTRLSHSQHAQVACTDCHQMGTRPGSQDHAPCDRCHRDAFLGAPGELCKVCHTKVTTAPLTAPLRPYPAEDIWEAEPSRFSHRSHMDAQRMEGKVGFHVACVDCHVRDGKLVHPDHATCSRCHAPEAGAPPAMTACATCHQAGVQQRQRARLIKGDLHFEHANHRTDRRGAAIKCELCHAQSATATSYGDHAAPRVESCVTCHDDSDRTPPAHRMRICETCHTARADKLTELAPRNHLPVTERPLDHTIAFRRDHAEAAERDGGRCAACHTQMSGNARDNCDECHQTMRPSDHRITWRELDHGTEAAADRDRCARCHVIEFCTACHSQRPRSHGFPGSFAMEHGALARTNVRACLTCHEEQGNLPGACAQCHTVPAARGAR
jgi:hypothetical protein